MNEQLPTRDQAIELLRKSGCASNVVRHCEAVAELAVEMAECVNKKGLSVDANLVEIGALLHDIGRSKTHGVSHGMVGSGIAASFGLSKSVQNVLKRHVGGGISTREAERLGWPKDVYVPQTLEEKIVSYADKLVDNHNMKQVSIDVEIERLQAAGHKNGAERVRRLHEEITALLSN